jgi:hypothetical protein
MLMIVLSHLPITVLHHNAMTLKLVEYILRSNEPSTRIYLLLFTVTGLLMPHAVVPTVKVLTTPLTPPTLTEGINVSDQMEMIAEV